MSAMRKPGFYLKAKLRTLAIKLCLSGRFDEDKVYILTSSPRSGSTLLGQVLNSMPGSCVLFEPLHPEKVPAARAAHFSDSNYVDPGDAWPEGERFLRRVFQGKVVNDWTSREMGLREACRSTTMIVKFVRANRILPWICRTFDVPPPIFLVRHPCAVVASQMNCAWMGTERPSAPPFLDDYPVFRSALSRTAGVEENLAARWALDQLPVLLHKGPRPWLVVTYEDLVLHPTPTLARIFKMWGMDVDIDKAMRGLEKPSRVVGRLGVSGTNGWQEQLTQEQISRILGVVNAFGLTFYGEAAEADHSVLGSGQLADQIRHAGRG